MHYAYAVPVAAIQWTYPAPRHGRASAEADRRWPMIVRKLAALRKRNRRSIRIVDADCGAGDLLLAVVRRARALGFLAIEARGIDRDPLAIAHARRASAATRDPAVALTFEVGDPANALREEAEFPADLLFYADQGGRNADLPTLARAAGQVALRASPRRGASA